MSDIIQHECGVALIRLLKPLNYYKQKYGSSRYGLHKMYQLMDKMINRGQDGAGVATVKLDTESGTTYIDRLRSVAPKATQDIFSQINDLYIDAKNKFPVEYNDINWQKQNIPFMGELILGHLRYGTFGGNTVASCHPFRRQNNWKARNLLVAGNFNLTNVDELLEHLIELGQHPTERADTVTVMEKIGHFLDKENDRLFKIFKEKGLNNFAISKEIQKNIDVANILIESSKRWDGGYVMAGMFGHGDAFVLRDPNGIRPAYVYQDDEVLVVASERPVIQTVFNVPIESVKELNPGYAIIAKKSGEITQQEILPPLERTACSFERIYFSRGNDADIYKERQSLGRYLVPQVLKAIDYNLENAVFSYIPNTAEIAFGGLIEGIDEHNNKLKATEILKLGKNITEPTLSKILSSHPRIHKIIIKDAKQRTFITDDESRDSLVNLVYDITYETIKKNIDTLVVVDDSIVRGTTLKQSILKILDRLQPKKIVIISSAPQIRYPDCYGIDMAVLGKFIAFNAAIALIKETKKESILNTLYERAKAELLKPKEEQVNVVQDIYRTFTNEEIAKKIAELLKPKDLKAELQIIFQTIEGLHQSCPLNLGDWYFTGNYPTSGGNKVSNKAFVNYMEGKNERAY
ncbi:MAG: amidophosphoribosyltransferase [Bacteroidota bacterium]